MSKFLARYAPVSSGRRFGGALHALRRDWAEKPTGDTAHLAGDFAVARTDLDREEA